VLALVKVYSPERRRKKNAMQIISAMAWAAEEGLMLLCAAVRTVDTSLMGMGLTRCGGGSDFS
jgi:hypothetical protein